MFVYMIGCLNLQTSPVLDESAWILLQKVSVVILFYMKRYQMRVVIEVEKIQLKSHQIKSENKIIHRLRLVSKI